MNNSFIISLFASFTLFVSCNNKVIPVQEVNPDKSYQFVSSSSKEKVWNEIIEVFKEKRLAIKTINKDSGFISTGITSFLQCYVWENKDSGLTDPDALVICSMNRPDFISTPPLKPDAITGQWFVLVKSEPGKTVIDMKLVNASGKVIIENSDPLPAEDISVETHNLRVESTGVLEKEIEKKVNK